MEYHWSQGFWYGDEQASWPHYVLLFLDNYYKWNIVDLNVFGRVMSKRASLIMFCYSWIIYTSVISQILRLLLFLDYLYQRNITDLKVIGMKMSKQTGLIVLCYSWIIIISGISQILRLLSWWWALCLTIPDAFGIAEILTNYILKKTGK